MKFPRWELRYTADPLDTRAYGGGGGDGGAGDMRRQEQERQAKLQASVDAINGKFGIAPAGTPTKDQFMVQGTGDWVPRVDEDAFTKATADYTAGQPGIAAAKQARETMYGDISSAVRDTAMRDLDRQHTDASRQNLFGLSRSGLLGGSVDAESGGQLATLYGEGRLKATQAGDHAGAELRSTDEKTRQNLIGLAQSGIDTGTAASMAAGQMASAADLAKSQSATASVGDLFGNLSQAYLSNQVMRARYPNGLPQQSANSPYQTNVFGANSYTGRESR